MAILLGNRMRKSEFTEFRHLVCEPCWITMQFCIRNHILPVSGHPTGCPNQSPHIFRTEKMPIRCYFKTWIKHTLLISVNTLLMLKISIHIVIHLYTINQAMNSPAHIPSLPEHQGAIKRTSFKPLRGAPRVKHRRIAPGNRWWIRWQTP